MRRYFLQILENKNLSLEGSIRDNINFLLSNKQRISSRKNKIDLPIFFGLDPSGKIHEQITKWEPRVQSLNPQVLNDIKLKNLKLELKDETRRDF
jgi:predicted component of type VI protein secretion system